MEKPIKIDDLGVPLFLETPISGGNKSSQKNRLTNSHQFEVHLGDFFQSTQERIMNLLKPWSTWHKHYNKQLLSTMMLQPRKLTANALESRKFLFDIIISGIYVSFWECTRPKAWVNKNCEKFTRSLLVFFPGQKKQDSHSQRAKWHRAPNFMHFFFLLEKSLKFTIPRCSMYSLFTYQKGAKMTKFKREMAW